MNSWIKELFGVEKPIIAMCHLNALPGDPAFDARGGMQAVIDWASQDLHALQQGGVDAVMFSNEFSMPYLTKVHTVTVAAMARVIGEIRSEIRVPFGVNVLWDPIASLDLAAATGAAFVREIFSGVYASDFGLWNPNCGEIVRHQQAIGAGDVRLFFNIVPEAAQYLANRDIVDIARSTVFNHRPDAICVSGLIAGAQTNTNLLSRVKEAVRNSYSASSTPVFANTGVRLSNLEEQLRIADGAIVGTTFKIGGIFENHVDPSRVREFMNKVNSIRGGTGGTRIPGRSSYPEFSSRRNSYSADSSEAAAAEEGKRTRINTDEHGYTSDEAAASPAGGGAGDEGLSLASDAVMMGVTMTDIINFLPDATLVIDREGKVIAWNQAMEKMTGIPAADMIGKGNYEYALPFYGERRPILIDLVLLPREEFEKKYTHIRRAGEILFGESYTPNLKSGAHHLSATASPLRDLNGNIVGAIESIRDNTERKRIEDTLQESQRRMADIINFLPDATLVIDQDGKVIAWNRAIEDLTGVKAADMLGKGDYEYALPFYGERRPILIDLVHMPLEEFEKKYSHIRRNGEILIGESYTPNLKSGAHYLYATASPLRDSRGNIVGAIEIIRDITERKRIEDTLQESQRRMADIINFLPDATLVIDQDGKVIAWNRAIEKMTGVKAADILGKGDYEYALPFYGERRPVLIDLVQEPREGFEQKYSHIQRMGETLIGESHTPNLQSGVRFVYATASPLRNSRGSIVGAIETVRDITERKRQQEELASLYHEVAQEKQYLESLIQNSPVAIVVMNLDNLVITWNPAAEKLFGYTQAEAQNHNIDDLITTESMRAESFSYTHALRSEGEGLVHAVTQRMRKDRSLVDVELLGVPVFVASEMIGVVAMYHDITELQHARRAAEAATRAKSEFLANMSHEIRTPMNGVIGMTSLLLDTTLNEEQHEYVETIRKSGDALLSIINDILDFSKIEAGKMELEMQPFDVRDCVEIAADLVAYRASEHGVELLTNIELDVPHAVIGDVTRLRQILANLLGNAVKFTEAGEIEVAVVKVEGGTLPGEDCRLHFSVRDTGVGIPPERANRLFQVFSQVDASTTRRFGGTGLGLAICKRLAEMMGGDIWAESEGVGKGSTFHLVLPFKISEAIRKTKVQASHIALQSKSLLVVDDNATNRLIVDRMARSWGMSTVDCSSAYEALEKVDAGLKVDAAVLDVQMPGMDGIMLSAELRRRPAVAGLPLVIISSLGQKLPLPTGVTVSAYMHKPIKPSQLYDALVSAFDEQPEVQSPVTVDDAGFDSQMGVRHPLRILIAEDHAVNQKVMRLMLERLGYRADLVADGLEVILSFKRQDYDVVLMDIQMPEMNGIEATQRLRKDLPLKRQPRIIALTANALGGEREEYLAAGMDDYLSKPVNVRAMRAALEKCMPLGAQYDLEKSEEAAGEEEGKRTRINADEHGHTPDEAAASSAGEGAGGEGPLPAGIPIPQRSSIDILTLKEYFPYEGEDIQMIIDLAEEFFLDTDHRMQELAEQVQQGDAAAVDRTAHAIKGASLTFGAKTFSGICKELEWMGKSGSLDGAAEKLAEAQAAYQQIRAELPIILKGMLP